MQRFATGLIAGGIVAALGVGYAMNDRRARTKMMKRGKKMASKAGHAIGDAIDDVKGNIW